MTKTPIDYSKTIIYKICCKDPNIKDVYVGSTTNFRSRKNQHKSASINPNHKSYNIYVYQFIRENGGWDNWQMIMIKEYTKCESKQQCLKKERKYIEKLNATLNTLRPMITKEEYKKEMLNRVNKWTSENKERVIKNKRNHYEKNKELIKQRSKISYEKNKEKISEKYKVKTQCECGSTIRKSDLNRHRKSKKHLKLLQQQNQ